MIGWLLGTRIGRWISALLTGATIVLAAWFAGRREGGQNARRKAAENKIKQAKSAQEVRDEVQGMDDERVRRELAKWMRDDD